VNRRVLTGLRVVSIAQNVPGPLAVARLVANGATAVKIEPLAGDPFAPLALSWYEEMHRDVAVERLDLKSPEGYARLMHLLSDAHVFIASHRPTALARLHLDPATLHAVAPGLHIVRIVGSVENPDEAGHDLTYQAQAGLLRDHMPPTLAADVMGSERAYAAVLEALRHSEGTTTDVGLVDSLAPLVAPLRHGATAPGGVLGGGAPRYGVYRARSGYVALAALEPHFEKRFYDLVALPMGTDPSSTLRERTADEWAEWGRVNDVPIIAVAGGAANA
jgi:alpha-methylacyl-CoA racemase